ncbi:MAG: glycogen-binding domain-containing protein, partial [Ignavibacteriales bacterium]|nr:glycogen-binding domain-containing protein [Ignavibacteriales bacterium]
MKKIIYAILVIISFFLLSCSPSSRDGIRDIIQPVKLIAGIADTFVVSDLFYSEDYDLNFSANPQLSVKFEKDLNQIILKANPDFEGMTLLDFELDGDEYSIPVTSRMQTKVIFKFKPQKKYNKITLFGVFNNWNRENLPMADEDGDGIYEIDLMLDPASYQFKYWADGEEFLDETYPTVPNGLGGYNSLMTVEKINNYNSFLH